MGGGGGLNPRHRRDLKREGWEEWMIRRAEGRMHSVDNEDAEAILGYPCEPGIAFDFGHDWKRVKPDRGRMRYASPKGGGCRVFFPEQVDKHDPSQDVLITEGEKKALYATMKGYPTIGLVGVYGWLDRRSGPNKAAKRFGVETSGPYGERSRTGMVPELREVNWNGRLVTIAFDSDLNSNAHVQKACNRLAEELEGRGAEVWVCRLPDPIASERLADGGKFALDSFLSARGDFSTAEFYRPKG